MIPHFSAQPKAVVFDFDGVILESAEIKTGAFVELFAAYPEHQAAITDYHLAHQGISRYIKFEWIHRELLGVPLEPSERERLGAAFSDIVLQKVLACPFVPGARELLQALQRRTLCFITSGTPQEELEFIVRERGLTSYFQGIWGTPSKKSEVVGEIREKYGLDPREVLFIGDGLSDFEAARAAGVRFLARDTPVMSEQWRQLGAERVPDLSRLVSVLGPRPVLAAR